MESDNSQVNPGSIIKAYIRYNRPVSLDEHQYYRDLNSFNEALEKAATARTRENKCHDHQRRVGYETMRVFLEKLKPFAKEIKAQKTFDGLFNIIESVGKQIHGIGELTIYDTAHRIGIYLGLEPTEVYIHAGTRQGAVAIGFCDNRKTIKKSELPQEFSVLAPHEIEDCLCIYKDHIKRLYSKRNSD